MLEAMLSSFLIIVNLVLPFILYLQLEKHLHMIRLLPLPEEELNRPLTGSKAASARGNKPPSFDISPESDR